MKTLSESIANKSEVQNLIIESLLISPIKNIISKLENNDFRDCDIKWLNQKLYNFTNIAAEAIGVKISTIDLIYDDCLLNDYKKNELIKSFKALLMYFETFK